MASNVQKLTEQQIRDRLGQRFENRPRSMPRFTITGHEYDKREVLFVWGLGNNRFAVSNIALHPNLEQELLGQLREFVTPKPAPQKRTVTETKATETDE